MIYTSTIDTPLGPMTAAAKDGSLIGLWFVGQKYYPSLTDSWIREPDYSVFALLRTYLERYFSGVAGDLGVPLDPPGSAFQKAVWDILLKIPMGRVATYGQIAKQLGRTGGVSRMSAQAVGGAVGHNRISILIPCHRVVGFDGRLTGYAGGLDKKAALLKIENASSEKTSNQFAFSFAAAL